MGVSIPSAWPDPFQTKSLRERWGMWYKDLGFQNQTGN